MTVAVEVPAPALVLHYPIDADEFLRNSFALFDDGMRFLACHFT